MGPFKSAALLPALKTCPLLSCQPIIKFFQGTQSPIPRPSAVVSPAVSCCPLSATDQKTAPGPTAQILWFLDPSGPHSRHLVPKLVVSVTFPTASLLPACLSCAGCPPNPFWGSELPPLQYQPNHADPSPRS